MGGLNRKHRRAGKQFRPKPRDAYRILPIPFRAQFDALAVLGGFANHVSMSQVGLPTTVSGSLASMVFAKSCAHARSIGAIAVQSSMFDHHAIMSLTRMILEASTMIAYLLDPVSDDEWAFRHTVLKLHDTVSRIKLLRSFNAPSDDLRTGREELKSIIITSPIFSSLPKDRQNRLTNGEDMFVIGMRTVATKIMGWNETKFMGIYAYFSAHTHSAPMSFVRMANHEIDYYHPSYAQISTLALSLEVSLACLRRSMLRMIDEHPEQIPLYHPDLLTDARQQDAESPFFAVD
ncbi:hypothetical protein [Sphingomonas radiodurans]|uniref:hypothetical protein n=1 Tax=Sphingomonas radiodurans TaxID=2890321 RepID=UPI001E490035|nr:hypothetical protein [Sphingomonas radiodurans]WBH15768.1 hypothetical protein LLW23_13215 [Sphingomonas radiodurans]